ncbi:DUF4279 domain-containing protein [Phenylobacterium sp.]|uniref:DUF4279 domain-containing protein n=1 Tax=Phenylobacterium sp. TaxID=1871053 RepID=UPI0011F69B4B|nr:DUF4279 domain-containing protein [Phenylobacterium sp.]THD67302.1 MAG: DUF4279 domain-containing protein [Phenylobacterium sp.]
MSELHETDATLRFIGEDLDPDEVTALLGQTPTHADRKGDVRILRDGSEYRERKGSWRRTVQRRTPGDLDGQVAELLSGLTEDMAVWKTLSTRFRADVFCGLFMREGNEGIALSPKTLEALGLRGLTLDFDLYGPEAI